MKKNRSMRRRLRVVAIACFITVALSPLVSLASAQSIVHDVPTGDHVAANPENDPNSSASFDTHTDGSDAPDTEGSDAPDEAPSGLDPADEAGASAGDGAKQTDQANQDADAQAEAAQPQDSSAAASPSAPPSSQTDPNAEAEGSTYYVSATGNDNADGTENDPLASIAAAVEKETEKTPTTVVLLSDITVQSTAKVGSKSVVVTSKSGRATLLAAPDSNANFFEMDTGNLTLKNIAVDGKSYLFDHHVVSLVNGQVSTTTVGSLILDNTQVKNWFSSGVSGAFFISAPKGAMVMKNASSIDNGQIQSAADLAGGAAIRVTSGQGTEGTVPSYSYRASLRLEDTSKITNCACNLSNAGINFSGGAAINAYETQVFMDKDTRITGCNTTFKNASGLLDVHSTKDAAGAVSVHNSKLDMAGTISDCHLYSKLYTSAPDVQLSGGGGLSIYVHLNNYSNKVDCRSVISGTVENCSAPGGGGVRYWTDDNGWGEGDQIWKVPTQAKSSKEAMDRVYDSLELTGTISNCWTEDVARTISLTDPAPYHYIGTGGGGICLANHGLLVVEDTARIENCHTGTKGGAISNLQTPILFRAESEGSQGALIKGCSSDGIAGGIAAHSFTNIENLRIDDCHAEQEGGAIYARDYNLIVYDCLITNCSAGTYGGAILQDVTHKIFWYGGTLKNNHAGIGGGGIVINTWLGAGDKISPNGIAFNYPTDLNGGYTNATGCQTTILVDKIKAPTVILGNTQEDDNKRSDIWTSDTSTDIKDLAKTRLFVYSDFIQGSRIGAIINEGVQADNAPGVQFGYVYGDDINLRVFGDDVDPGLVGSYDTTNHTYMVWKRVEDYTVTYEGNPRPGTSISGSVPFDGFGHTQRVYGLNEDATVLGPGDMKDQDFTFLGWSTDPHAKEASYQPDDSLSYSTDIDLGGGNIVLYAVWSDRPYICQIIRQQDGKDTLFKQYATLYEAFRDTQPGDRVEMFKDAPLVNFEDADSQFPDDGCLKEVAPGDVLLTTAPKNQPVDRASAWMGEDRGDTPIAILTRTQSGSTVSWMQVSAGSLTTKNITFDGACSVAQVKAGTPGVQGNHALIEVTNEKASLTLDEHTTIHSAYDANGVGGGVSVLDRASLEMNEGAEITDCSAEKGGGMQVFSLSSQAVGHIQGGSIHDNYALSYGGGVFCTGFGTVVLNNALIQANEAGTSGGGIYLEQDGQAQLSDSQVTNNTASAERAGALGEEMVGGIGLGQVSRLQGNVQVAGKVLVSNNLGHRAGQTADEPAVASDLQAEVQSEQRTSLMLVGNLDAEAYIGIISDQPETLDPGAQFGSSSPSDSATYSNLERFFNDTNDTLFGIAGDGKAIIWQPSEVVFTKVGANQTTGLYDGLARASFNVYRYRGTADLNATTINDGTIDLASLSSLQWAPLIDEKGTEGSPGNKTNTPYTFTSVDGDDVTKGTTTLTGLKTNVWYMLVENDAPQNFSKPSGQWAFQITKGQGEKTTTPDLDTMLAHKGSDGSLPPAFARQVVTAEGQKTGVFLINIPVFDLPFTGIGQMLLWGLAALGLVAAAVGLRLRTKRHGEVR